MPANMTVSVCVATSHRPLIEMDAIRAGHRPPALLNRGQNILRPRPEANQVPQRRRAERIAPKFRWTDSAKALLRVGSRRLPRPPHTHLVCTDTSLDLS